MNSLLFPRDLNTTCWNILLFSSYVFKSQLRFELATKKLVLDSKLLDDGRLVTSNGSEFGEGVPAGIISGFYVLLKARPFTH